MAKLSLPCIDNSVVNDQRKENNSTIWELLSPEQKRAINKLRDAK